MTSALRFLTDHTLSRLETGLKRLASGDRREAQALGREANDVLLGVQPLNQFILQHGRVLGALGLLALLGTLVAGFNLLTALGDATLARAFASGMTTAAGATFLILATSVARRTTTATTLAVAVLKQLGR